MKSELKEIKDVVFCEKYKNNENEEKTKYTKIGTQFHYESGGVVQRLNFIPTNMNEGTIRIFSKKEEK